MKLYIKVAIRTDKGIVEKKIDIAQIIEAFFTSEERCGANPSCADVWESLSTCYDGDLFAYKPGPAVSLRVAGSTSKGAVVAMVKSEHGGMTPNRPEIMIGGESQDNKIYPLAGVSLETLVGEKLWYKSRLEIGSRPAERVGMMEGEAVALSQTVLSDGERNTDIHILTSAREVTEGLSCFAKVNDEAAAVKSQEQNPIDDVYKMIDKDAVKADCVTKREIRERLARYGEEDLFKDIDELSDEEVENGFYIVQTDASDSPYMALEVQRIDAIADLGIPGIPATDEEAGERARRVGIPFINDIPGVDKDRFVDIPENRELVRKFYEERKRNFRVNFSLSGSIVIPSFSAEKAKSLIEDGVSNKDEQVLQDVFNVLRGHLEHLSIDDVEEED